MIVVLSRLLERRYFYWVPKMPQGDGQRHRVNYSVAEGSGSYYLHGHKLSASCLKIWIEYRNFHVSMIAASVKKLTFSPSSFDRYKTFVFLLVCMF